MSSSLYPTVTCRTSIIKRPVFSSLMQQSVSGRKKKIANWLYPRWEMEIEYENLRQDGTDWESLVNFFLLMRGSAESFLLDDTDDNWVTGQQLGLGDGETTQFQLLRRFGGLDAGFIEVCKDIKSDPAPKIYLDTVLQESGYSIDLTDSGLVSFETHPGAGVVVAAEFGFYWRCCFTEDQSEFEKFLSKLWKGKVSLETEK